MTVARIPLSVRTLILLPLLAAGVDLTRATAACGTHAQTCLEAAGRGWLGPVAVLLLIAFSVATAWRLVRRLPSTPTSFVRLWALGTTGVAVACTGQALLARALGGNDTVLGGSAPGVLALCVVAGALLALVLRVTDRASLPPLKAPRPGGRSRLEWLYVRADRRPALPVRRGPRRGRAPPVT